MHVQRQLDLAVEGWRPRRYWFGKWMFGEMFHKRSDLEATPAGCHLSSHLPVVLQEARFLPVAEVVSPVIATERKLEGANLAIRATRRFPGRQPPLKFPNRRSDRCGRRLGCPHLRGGYVVSPKLPTILSKCSGIQVSTNLTHDLKVEVTIMNTYQPEAENLIHI